MQVSPCNITRTSRSEGLKSSSQNFQHSRSDWTLRICFQNANSRRKVRASATRQTRSSRKRTEEAEAAEEGQAQAEHPSFFASGAAQVGNLVNTLLFGAASRIERGTSVCVSCRGTGTMFCKECQATGVVKQTTSKSKAGGLKGLVGTKSKEKQWIVSNRCRNCGGHGRLECPKCNGLGKRFIDQSLWE